jgi:hypothetical protein
MAAWNLRHLVDRNGIEGDIVRTLESGPGGEEKVLVVFRHEHCVMVPTTALIERRARGGESSYFLPLSLVELERHQRAFDG